MSVPLVANLFVAFVIHVPPRLKEMFPIVFRQVRQVYNYDRFTTGFAIAPLAFFQHMRKQYTEFWKQVQAQP